MSCRGSEVWQLDGDAAPVARENIYQIITLYILKYWAWL